jgi:cytochrome c553
MTTDRNLILASMLLALPGLSLAADPDAGRTKAEACLACHFSDDFVGEREADILLLIEAIRAADSGHPDDGNDLSETDLADIAAFFAQGE